MSHHAESNGVSYEASGIEYEEPENEQIRVSLRLADGVNDRSLEVPPHPIAIPSKLRRRGLSAVVNHLLGRSVQSSDQEDEKKDGDESDEEDKYNAPSIPFDFVVNGKLLRMSVEGVARRDGLSMEQAIEIKYFPALPAPEGSGSGEVLPDWASEMSFASKGPVGGDGILCVGCYDGSLRAFSPDDCEEVASIMAHSGPVKSLSCLGRQGSGDVIVATGSMDQSLRVHVLAAKSSQNKGADAVSLSPHALFSGGHFNSVESVALFRASSISSNVVLASGDWNGAVCLWNVPSDSEVGMDQEDHVNTSKSEDSAVRKKQRSGASKWTTQGDKRISECPPSASWKAHAGSVSGMVWGEETGPGGKLITSSWDHSCKVWDVEREDCVLSLNGSRVISALGRCVNSDIVATGHPDCTIRLWDMRVGCKDRANSVWENSLRPSHKAWISSLRWSPKEPHVLATNSHDGCVKMWDIRSPLPLHTVRAHGRDHKGLCLAFGGDTLFTGGSDCVVKQFSV